MRHLAAIFSLGLLTLAACGGKKEMPPQGPAEVGVITVSSQSAALETELSGRTSPYESSEVRPQVAGLIKGLLFKEGSQVRAGQPLYQIDSATYRASFDQAQASLANAEANLTTAKLKADRYAGLVKIEAVAKQDADDATAAYKQALANVALQKAAVQNARISLGYTTVTAPISGRISKSNFTVGALVTASQTGALATIQRLDPIYVDLTQSSVDLLKLRTLLAKGGALPANTLVRLKLEDGSDYPQAGTLQFTDVTVDPSTGAVTLRAQFPNPDGVLLPGMYVRAVFDQAVDPNAILVPQQGITRNAKGEATALVVGADNKVALRDVVADRAIGDKWLISKGLNPGDRLIVEGVGKAKPGAMVKPVPAGSKPTPRPAKKG